MTTLFIHPDSEWWADRCALRQRLAEQAGIAARCVPAPRRITAEWMLSQIDEKGVGAVAVHCLVVEPHVVDYVARQRPEIRVAQVLHSSLPHLATSGWKSEKLKEALQVTKDNPNVSFGTPDERNILGRITGCDRVVWIPNPMGLHELPKPIFRARRKPLPTIVLSGRADPVKNWPHQLAACALMRPCEVALVLRETNRLGLPSLIEAFRLPIRSIPFMRRAEWLKFLQDEADLVFQVSQTESFNYVGLEALALGVPVVGSPALRYLPSAWRANPDDPDDIVRLAQALLSDPKSAFEHARQVGRQYAREMDLAYIDWLSAWSNPPRQSPKIPAEPSATPMQLITPTSAT